MNLRHAHARIDPSVAAESFGSPIRGTMIAPDVHLDWRAAPPALIQKDLLATPDLNYAVLF